MSKRDIKNFNIVGGDGEYENPKDCELAEIASQKLEKDNTEAHYRFINILTLTLLLIFSATLFLTVSGSNIVDDSNNVLTLKTFLSGDYTRSLKSSYDHDLPFPEEMKMLEERLSLIYGIGNKVSDPVKEIDDNTDSDRNSFDIPDEGYDYSKNNNNEKKVTSAVTDEMGITVTTTNKADEGKKTTTTTAIDRPYDDGQTSTTTSETPTTTNTEAPYFTVTETYPVSQPAPTQTRETEPPTQTKEPEPDTGTASQEPEPEPPVDSEPSEEQSGE